MVSSIKPTENYLKLIMPFITQSIGILSDVLSTYIASLYGIPEGNPNVNPVLEFIALTTIMALGMIIYKNIKNELYYIALVIISFIPFIPAIYNLCVLIILTSFPF